MRKYLDEAHEQAAILIFIAAICLRVFTDMGDYATLGTLFLSVVTLLGMKRFKGFKVGPIGSSEDVDDDGA